MSDELEQLRQHIVQTIREYHRLDQQFQQAIQAAKQQRQQAIAATQQQYQARRARVEQVVANIRSHTQRAQQLLSNLGLPTSAGGRGAVTPPSGSLKDLVHFLEQTETQLRQHIAHMETTAKRLREERKKWWKFW